MACSSELAPPSFDDDDDDPAEIVEGLRAPLRRLSAAQYENTVRAVFGVALPEAVHIVDGLPLDDSSGWFLGNAAPLGEAAVVQYQVTAERIAQAVVVHRGALAACLDDAAITDVCVRAVAEDLAARAWRRPISVPEADALVTAFGEGSVEEGLLRLVTLVLQSPDFLYRVERGEPDLLGGDDVRLTGHEIAARLSYLLWGGPPDAALTADAEAGRLHDPGYRAKVVARLLDDPRAAAGLAAMHRAWLGVGHLSTLVKDRNLFPTFSDRLGAELDDELAGFVDHVLRGRDGTLSSLLTANVTVAKTAVTSWYGDDVVEVVSTPEGTLPEGASLLVLDPTRRAGVLTLMSTMAAHAKTDRSDPVRRGSIVRTRLLCEPLAAPPPDVPVLPEQVAADATLRERLAAHTDDPSCAGCHRLIDPLGFAFEAYDAMGQFRVEDGQGATIDSTGEIVGTDVAGPVAGPVALAAALADSDQVARCYVGQWLRWALGRELEEDDEELLAALEIGFVDNGGHVPTLLAELVASEAFVRRSIE